MTSGKYFNRGVIALDSHNIGYVVRETEDKIVVFGDGKNRYDIPKSAIRFVSKNVLIDLPYQEINNRYKVKREDPLPASKPTIEWNSGDVDLATYEGKYPKSLFNKGVRTDNADNVGHIMAETDDMIVVFGDHDYRYDIPKREIIAVGRNVILGMNFPEVFKYKVDKNAALPSGEPVEKLAEQDQI